MAFSVSLDLRRSFRLRANVMAGSELVDAGLAVLPVAVQFTTAIEL